MAKIDSEWLEVPLQRDERSVGTPRVFRAQELAELIAKVFLKIPSFLLDITDPISIFRLLRPVLNSKQSPTTYDEHTHYP